MPLVAVGWIAHTDHSAKYISEPLSQAPFIDPWILNRARNQLVEPEAGIAWETLWEEMDKRLCHCVQKRERVQEEGAPKADSSPASLWVASGQQVCQEADPLVLSRWPSGLQKGRALGRVPTPIRRSVHTLNSWGLLSWSGMPRKLAYRWSASCLPLPPKTH